MLDQEKKYIDVQLLNATGGEGVEGTPTATFDVNHAIWVNGNENIGFPNYHNSAINWGDGNIQFKEGASFVKGEPIYIVVDFTAGLNAGVMKVDTKPVLEGIQSITADDITSGIYTLAGVRAKSTSQPGIYIVGGRKVMR